MKDIATIAMLTFIVSSSAMAQSEDCGNLAKLRNRSGSLDLALAKIDTGIKISVTQNGDFTSQFLTVLLFENYICKLNQVLVARGQPPIANEVVATWVEEIDGAYEVIDVATDSKPLGTLKANFIKARTEVLEPWKPAGAKTSAYAARLPTNVSKEFLGAVPTIDLTKSISGSAYAKTIVNQGFSGEYESVITKGEALVGNQLFALENMRKSVGMYAAGSTPAATMLRDIVGGVIKSVSQITDKRSAALQEIQMKLDADAKAREAIASTASLKIAELEKRIAEVETRFVEVEKKTKAK